MVGIGLIACQTIELRISDKLNEEPACMDKMLRMKADTNSFALDEADGRNGNQLTLALNGERDGDYRPVKIIIDTTLTTNKSF